MIVVNDILPIAKVMDWCAKAAIDTLCMSFKKDGLHIRDIDGSHSAMIDFFMKKELFKKYRAIGDVWVNLSLLHKKKLIQKLRGSIGIEVKDAYMILDTQSVKYKMRLVEEEEKSYPKPKIDFLAKYNFNANVFSNALKEIVGLEEQIIFESDGSNKLSIISKDVEGLVSGSVSLVDETLTSSENKKCVSSFGNEYVRDALGLMDASSNITVRIGEKCPVLFEMDMAGALCKLFIAPRVEPEEIE